jgi:MoaA/NifB/PqqE/SkfB family radical SAM enzyme
VPSGVQPLPCAGPHPSFHHPVTPRQACSHCHVESSPLRTEAMGRATAVRCLELAEDALERGGLRTLDITGGAPELSPQFRPAFEGFQRLPISVCGLGP